MPQTWQSKLIGTTQKARDAPAEWEGVGEEDEADGKGEEDAVESQVAEEVFWIQLHTYLLTVSLKVTMIGASVGALH